MDKQLHVLVVDDDPLLRRLLGSWVTKLGMEALYAANGLEAFESARKFHPDLILLDYHMPGQDGLQTLMRMKGDPATHDLKVIFLTNEDLSVEAEKNVQELGVAQYVHKSVPYEEFSAHVKKVLGLP